MDSLLTRIYSERVIPRPDGTSIELNIYIPRSEGELLARIILEHRPQHCLEVGLAAGISTLFITRALAESGGVSHTAIDPFQHSHWKGAGLGLIEYAGLSRFLRFVEMFSHQALPEIEREGKHIQFAFIDGAHLFDYALVDFLVIDRILDCGGLIAFDDADWPAVKGVIRFALSNRHYEVAYPDVVIEPPATGPTLRGNLMRQAGKLFPSLGEKLRGDFFRTDEEMGIVGRCVVLRKLKDDDRDSQDVTAHVAF